MQIMIPGKEVIEFSAGEIYEEYQIYEYVRSIHYRKDDFDDGNLGEHIEEYERYEGKIINVDDVEEAQYYIDYESVDEFKEMNEETSPPVVLGYYSDGSYHTIDGGHRITVAKLKGYKTIKAFVGVRQS